VLERVGGWVVVPRSLELARVVGRGGRLSEMSIDKFAFASSLLSSSLLFLSVFAAEAGV
jgi:hypothetical protein